MSKGKGQKIAIKFDKALLGDVTETTGDPNEQAADKSHTASHEPSGYEASKAFDGNLGTMWRPGYRLVDTWITVDMGEPKPIDKLRIRSATSSWYTAWQLQGSDDNATWTPIIDGGHTAASQMLEYAFPLATYRYWRILCTARNGNYPGFSIIEMYWTFAYINARAFTITGNVRNPLKTGELEPKTFQVASVERYMIDEEPAEDTILLTFDTYNRFNDVDGQITVAYDQAKGTLKGTRPVESFAIDFTPEDLEPTPIDDHTITAAIELTADFIPVTHIPIHHKHDITAGIDLTVALINVDDINP